VKLENRGTLFVVISAVMWGISGVGAQFLFQFRGVDPLWLSALRLVIPGLFLTFLSVYKWPSRSLAVWRVVPVKLVVFSVFGMGAVQLTFFLAIKHSNAATATVLQFINPVFIAIYLSVKELKLPSKRVILAIVLCLAGTLILTTHVDLSKLAITPKALLFGILSALASAFYTLFSIGLIANFGAITVVGKSMLVSGLILSIFYPPWAIVGVWDSRAILSAVYVVSASVFTFSLFLSGARMIGGQKASILGSVEPLAAVVVSVAFLNTPFTFFDAAGSIVIILTVIILHSGKPVS
jgi:drug/metabolite transporter (DMT)-like permease